jgi:serine/threonine protein kinase
VLARLDDPGVARVYDVDVSEGRPYVVLEYVAGQTLADVLRRDRLPFRAAAALVAKTAGILHRLHRGGLLHRDLKPANILIDKFHRPRLLDFGLASLTEQWGEINPPEKSISGTVWYMSPEQASGQPERIGPWTDVFGLGAVLYAMLTSRPPYVGQDPMAVLEEARQGRVTPPRQVNPAIPRSLGRICRKALAADPEKRYASAGQMQQALRLFLWRGRLLAAASCMMVIVALFLLWRPWAPADRPDVPTGPGPNDSSQRLVVDELKILLAEGIDNKKTQARRVLGIESFGATLDDDIKVSAHLSRPAYCYLIVFRPDGVNEILYPQSPDVAPELTDEPHYPSTDRSKVYGLNDATGLWLVALVASDGPLPAYGEWHRQHCPIPWTRSAGEPNCVYIDDGRWLERVRSGGIRNRGDRGEKEATGSGPIVRLVNWLKAETGGTVSAVAFTVQAKK